MKRISNNRATLLAAAAGALTIAGHAMAALPPVPVPAENPITEPKRVLGKILFWDEQLSANNAVACGTCHIPGRSGTDGRAGVNPGPDGITGNGDDKRASPGVPRSNADLRFVRDSVFGTNTQVTSRSSPSNIDAMYAPNLFWDGRATGTFTDPQTGQVMIASGGALESQCVNPPVSSAEMGHDSINWNEVIAKLSTAAPLDLATTLPADVQTALSGNPGYPELFRRAFGDTNITATRIAFALATYQRTLVADQTPWDRFQAGQTNALTAAQQAGMQAFNTRGQCNNCHTAPIFSSAQAPVGAQFRNIGIRPPTEDTGRQQVTGAAGDLGRMKVPTLRNVALKTSFMHTGQFTQFPQVMNFYARLPGGGPQFPQNQDPLIPQINLQGADVANVDDFVRNGLLDQRVANQTFPFDKPTLTGEQAARRTTQVGSGVVGSGGVTPKIIADMPPVISFNDWRVGVDGALGGARARLFMSTTAPVGNNIPLTNLLGTVTALGTGSGQGLETFFMHLSPNKFSGGQVIYLQWVVDDAAAAGGLSRSPVARVPLFCPSSGCATPCSADLNDDGSVNFFDYLDFVDAMTNLASLADFNHDGVIDFFDYLDFVDAFSIGCP